MSSQLFVPSSYFVAFAKLRIEHAWHVICSHINLDNVSKIRCFDFDEMAEFGKLNWYRRADKSLARSASRCILFDGENISFDVNSINISPIIIINTIYENQNLLSL
jgi:hypothetical protein